MSPVISRFGRFLESLPLDNFTATYDVFLEVKTSSTIGEIAIRSDRYQVEIFVNGCRQSFELNWADKNALQGFSLHVWERCKPRVVEHPCSRILEKEFN